MLGCSTLPVALAEPGEEPARLLVSSRDVFIQVSFLRMHLQNVISPG